MGKSNADWPPAAPAPQHTAALRFPLVPRSRAVCRALDVRVAQVRCLAQAAARHNGESLVRAAEAHNLAALIMSDCGMPAAARTLCWQQFEVFAATRPGTAATAKLTLQPLVNLGRLLIRDGDGAGAYHLLDTLYMAVRSRTEAVIDGRKIRLILSPGNDHGEVTHWLSSVLLADGTRALARAGQWAEALQHASRHHGIGDRLLDGRQVEILAHCAARNYDTACSVLANISTPTPWEEAVAACLTVLCLKLADRAADSATTAMADRYLRLAPMREHAVFQVRLGLCVIDLAAENHGVQQVARHVARHALESADAYAAHDALSDQTCLSHATAEDASALAQIVAASGLGCGTMPADMLDDLMESVRVSEVAISGALAVKAIIAPTGPVR